MKNSKIVFASIAVVAVLAFGAFTFSQNTSKSDVLMEKDVVMMPAEESTTQPVGAMMEKQTPAPEETMMTDEKEKSSQYVTYSNGVLESTSSNRRVLFFYATWCPSCKQADESFKKNISKIPTNTTLIRVHYNDQEATQEEKELAKKYGITYQHTFVQIDSAGSEVSKWNGGEIDELLSNLK